MAAILSRPQCVKPQFRNASSPNPSHRDNWVSVVDGQQQEIFRMMTSSNGNIFFFTGPLRVESIGHRVDSPHKGQWRGALMFSLLCAWINACSNNRDPGDLRRHRAQYDVIEMCVVNFGFWMTVFHVTVCSTISVNARQYVHYQCQWPLLLTCFNFNPSMDK